MPEAMTLPWQLNSSFDRAAELAVEAIRQAGNGPGLERDDFSAVTQLLGRKTGGRAGTPRQVHRATSHGKLWGEQGDGGL